MERIKSALIGSACLMFSIGAFGASLVLDKDKGHVDFHAVGKPGIIKIHGKGEGPTGQLNLDKSNVTGILHFKLDSLDTENNMRNEHMKNKYLEVAKFPEALLEVKEVALPPDFLQKKGTSLENIAFSGALTLHGVTKPVTGTIKVSNHGDNLEFSSHFETKISDYGISVPSFSGITVADEVKIDVDSTGKVAN